MRMIKFRGKDRNGNWHYGDLVHSSDSELCRIHDYDQNAGFYRWFSDIDPETVGQFTGFDNCFGNEIYEGDILIHCNSQLKFLVVYHQGSFGISDGDRFIPLIYLYLGSDSCYRVIGNIHDNPDLIEKGGIE